MGDRGDVATEQLQERAGRPRRGEVTASAEPVEVLAIEADSRTARRPTPHPRTAELHRRTRHSGSAHVRREDPPIGARGTLHDPVFASQRDGPRETARRPVTGASRPTRLTAAPHSQPCARTAAPFSILMFGIPERDGEHGELGKPVAPPGELCSGSASTCRPGMGFAGDPVWTAPGETDAPPRPQISEPPSGAPPAAR